MFSAVCQFVGVALVYNIDKKTLAQMSHDLKRDVEADDTVLISVNDDL
jgi:hypothetical protein